MNFVAVVTLFSFDHIKTIMGQIKVFSQYEDETIKRGIERQKKIRIRSLFLLSLTIIQ